MTVALLLIALLAGFVVLVLAGDALVRGAAAMARRAGVPPLLVGLTIVAFGTSAPELFVSVEAVLSDAPGLAIGNIVGSNIANILLVLALPSFFAPIATSAIGVRRNAVIMVLASLALVAFAWGGELTRVHGLALLAGIVLYLAMQAVRAREHRDDPDIQELLEIDSMEGMPDRWWKIWAFISVGVIGLPAGGALIVHGGVGLAELLDIPHEFVGLTIVAFGTSLPEIATSLVAAMRRHSEVAIGNVLGSNIFNVFVVGGAAATAGTIPTPDSFYIYNFPVMLAASAAALIIVLSRRTIGPRIGVVFLIAYVAYIVGLAFIEGVV